LAFCGASALPFADLVGQVLRRALSYQQIGISPAVDHRR
jgi:hypothetical protein